MASNVYDIIVIAARAVQLDRLTRMLAIARRCPAPLEPVFVTLSQAVRVVREQGFLVEYLPSHTYLGCDIGRWNSFLREELNELISFYDPRIVVFDGHVPHSGLVGAIDDNRQLTSIWCRLGMWGSHYRAVIIKRERHFDAVIEPRDVAQSFYRRLTTQYRDRTRLVAPIRLLDPEEMLDREAARRALDLRQDDPAVLIMLGSDNNYDYEPLRKVVLAWLGKADRVQIIVAGWLVAEQPIDLPEHVRRLTDYPISRCLAAFDFAVSAAGYNSFHELLFAAIPTIFVPHERPQQDDQLARAEFAQSHGFGLCVRRRTIYELGPALDRLLNPEIRDSIRARCAMLASPNGADQAARIVKEIAYEPLKWTPE